MILRKTSNVYWKTKCMINILSCFVIKNELSWHRKGQTSQCYYHHQDRGPSIYGKLIYGNGGTSK